MSCSTGPVPGKNSGMPRPRAWEGRCVLLSLLAACSGTADSVVDPGPTDPPDPPDSPASVATVAVAPQEAVLEVGAALQFTAEARDSAGAVLVGRTVSWSSSDPTAATVEADGSVHGEAPGTATITADVEGVSGSAPVVVVHAPATLIGAGDIADCATDAHERTAALLDAIEGTVFTAGDNAYDDGTPAEFADCYDPHWGRHKARTRPAVGDNEYQTPEAAGYFGYFGSAAGPLGKGWYTYELGAWKIIVLNSNANRVGVDDGSEQVTWLRAELTGSSHRCTLAYWHEPRFSSGYYGDDATFDAFWTALYEHGADVVLVGHDHHYERLAPLDPAGDPDPVAGIRQFIVGTGGRSLRPAWVPRLGSEVRESETFGVLRLTLRHDSYDWEFIPVEGQTFTDSGSATCH